MTVLIPVKTADGLTKGVITVASPVDNSITRPTGAGITLWESIKTTGRMSVKAASVAAPQKFSFLPGTFEDPNFQDPSNDPVYTMYFATPTLFAGSGIDKTIFSITPNSSTRANVIPLQTTLQTNQYTIMRFGGAVTAQDFTLLGTAQPVSTETKLPHSYNGLEVYEGIKAVIQRVKIKNIYGDASEQPGETFGINDYRGNGNSYISVEVDGNGVGASGIGLNMCTNMTFTNCLSHNNPYSAGITAFESSNLHYINFVSNNNHTAFNFEQTSGTIVMDNCTAIRGATAHHMIVDSNSFSPKGAVVTINNPTYDGSKFIVLIHAGGYGGKPQTQLASNIKMFVNGKDVTATDLQIVTS